MRFSLYGECEGLLGESRGPFVVEAEGVIVDISRTAARAGVQLGMTVGEAVALVPGCHVTPATEESASWRHLRQVLWAHTPWVETHPLERRFWIEISGARIPLSELRQIACEIRQGLTEEQRIVFALARTPWQARMLLSWSRHERVPGALYRKLGSEALVVAPDLLAKNRADWSRAPVAAAWWIPAKAREELVALGVFRLEDLENIPDASLCARFGEGARVWRTGGGQRQILRPDGAPDAWSVSWRADAEGVPLEHAVAQTRRCVEALCKDLAQVGLAAQTLCVTVWTDAQEIRWEKRLAKPTHRPDALWAQISWPKEMEQVRRCWGAELCATDVTQLQPVQANLFEQTKEMGALKPKVVTEVAAWEPLMARWPKLRRGMAVDFRERRLALLLAEMAQ
ncbi:Y-family DNA polymerase [Alicyclobacillus vulcanalis]|uniref:Nucleotidyltransferase/DNA polymerase involved in DNA repair n=1 Tax=Alicyclobacillus vulcanalis TaxID=252246 RepID=A0A1N7LY29_9BACL|nr:DNA repair nucleotidyltransferase [Alicyclobacillus vulcanalis]SIS78758.1 Nucleotidyltransferase/DNA polymerase involved in DNA repair [Alicyclobacillus vulcanalis]